MNNTPATPLLIARNLYVTPLIDIENPAFAKHYHNGLCWSLSGDYKGHKPFSDAHLVANLKRDAAKGYFGVLHGCILSPQTGQIRPDVTALVTFTHPDIAHGYYVGRRDCFMGTPPNERVYTDGELLEELRQIALDVMGYPDEENSWYYSIGCVFGNLSMQVFSAMPEEYQQWDAEYRQWRERYE